MRTMVPLSLDDFASAPFRFTASGPIAASASSVFVELGDPSRWFPLMSSCAWHGRVGGVGSEREVHVRLFGTFRETMLAWVPDARVAFTMTHTSSPLIARMAEDFVVTPGLGGVRLDWTVAAELTRLGRAATPVLRKILARMFAAYRPRLERLAAAAEPLHGTPAS